tara:strand:+ start:11545 stop:12582 length:1038 start_codon:yes stop_codon:yes gene_type:complete
MQRLETPIHDAFSIGAIREELVRHGVSIVRVVDDAHAAIIEQDTSHVPMLLREDGGTPHGARGMGGIAKGYGAACDPAVATVRVMDEIRGLFAGLYDLAPSDVMSGWDAIAITGNDAGRDRSPTTASLNHDNAQKAYQSLTNSTLQPHVDVGVDTHGSKMEDKMKDLHPILPCCVQGQYVVTSVARGGATLVVSPGAYVDALPNPDWFTVENGRDFCTCTPSGYDALRGTWRAVEAPRGCVILWLSRLPHGNKLSDFGVDPHRFVIYVSWQARALVTDEERRVLKRKKMDAVTTGATTDHWATNAKRVYRGSHYSNGAKKTKVVYSADNPPTYDDALRAKIEDAF